MAAHLLIVYGSEQAALDPATETRLLHQHVRRLTGWTLPEIRRLSYLDIVETISYENEARKAETGKH